MMPKPIFYRTSNRRWVAMVVAVIVIVAVAAAFVITRGRSGDGRPAAVGLVPGDQPTALLHVHGLAVNPADEAVYVATHGGLYRLTGQGDAERIGASQQDLMGFTVTGPDRFLASGHPDVAGIRAGHPGQLGLIESDDGGETWALVSLTGEADLHALAYRNGRAYAVDAVTGRFLVSDDLQEWTRRQELPATALAIDPADRDRVVAATGGVLLETLDAGATWEELPGPDLVFVAWDADGGLWGVTADGEAHQRAADTGAWEPLPPLPGEPQAIASNGGRHYASVQEGDRTAIYTAAEGGWELLFHDR